MIVIKRSFYTRKGYAYRHKRINIKHHLLTFVLLIVMQIF